MSIKLKALGLGLIAMLAMGSFAVVNAGATTSGHFVTASSPTFVTGFHPAGSEHKLDFIAEDGSEIGCTHSTYFGEHVGTKTTTSLTITPIWTECFTTPSGSHFEVHENGCTLDFTSRANPAANDATVKITCPVNKKIEITHPSCVISVGEQEVGGVAGNGVTYTNKNDGTPWITMDVAVDFAVTYHSGICIFLGTNHSAEMKGSVTVTGYSSSTHSTASRTGIEAT